MNKSDLIRAIADKAGITIKEADKTFDATIDVIVETLKAGEKVQISGFGSFELKEKGEREGINPSNGEKVHIAASKSPTLKFGKAFKELFND